jgi:hypothetical protein
MELATVIPIYKKTLDDKEATRVSITLKQSQRDATFFVGPRDLDLGFYTDRWPDVAHERFDSEHFQSVDSYSAWMLAPDLYSRFADYEFILVCQTDAMLVKPLVSPQLWQFDFLGAPWEPPHVYGWDPFLRKYRRGRMTFSRRVLRVGNGGLSLRRTRVFQNIAPPASSQYLFEDIVISLFSETMGIRVADIELARQYFMEMGVRTITDADPVPDVHGFHALNKFNPELEERLFRMLGA